MSASGIPIESLDKDQLKTVSFRNFLRIEGSFNQFAIS